MADIFISYASEDRDRIMPVVRSLEAHGWSVWWDRIIPPGKTFARVIEEALGAARCLIVLWTHASVRSDWVANEAAEGARRRILIPALLDGVEGGGYEAAGARVRHRLCGPLARTFIL